MYRLCLKRIFDMFFTLLALPLFIAIFVPVALLIKFEDGGPIFYCGKRVGKDKKNYKMYKFRSMKVDSPDIRNEDGSTFNSNVDHRVTNIGKILRETSLDETPQLLNVLKGDMSLIGPRPGLDSNLGSYREDELDKLKVRPGITGFTQAYYRNGISNREKRIKDAWYANNVSLWLDLKIFFKTISTVAKREKLYNNDSNEAKNVEGRENANV